MLFIFLTGDFTLALYICLNNKKNILLHSA